VLSLGVAGVSAFVFWAISAQVTKAPWIMPDELIYSDLSRSMASLDAPSVRGVTTTGYGFVYPLLIAPAWLVGDLDRAYAVARALNALLLTSSLFVGYALARHFLDRTRALVVAALTIAVPSMIYGAVIMTENAFYPVFLLAVLGIVRALERPTVARQLAAFGLIGLAVLTKSKSAVLVGAYIGAVLLYAFLERRGAGRPWRRTIGSYKLSLGFLLGALVAAAVAPHALLGEHANAFGSLDFGGLPRQLFFNVAEFDLYLAVLPLIGTVLVAVSSLRHGARPEERLYTAVAAPVVLAILISVSTFAEATRYRDAQLVNERNVFVIAPLFFIGLMLWLGSERIGRRTTILVAAVAGALPALIAVSDFSQNAAFQALALVPWLSIGLPDGLTRIVLLVLCLGLASLVLLPKRLSMIAPMAVGVLLIFFCVYAKSGMKTAGEWASSHGVGAGPTWIDDAVGGSADVTVVWQEPAPRSRFEARESVDPRTEHLVVWVGEFFNRSVGDVVSIGRPMPYKLQLPIQGARLSGNTVVDDNGRSVRAAYVLALCRVGVDAPAVATDRALGAAVYRVDGTIRLGGRRSESCS